MAELTNAGEDFMRQLLYGRDPEPVPEKPRMMSPEDWRRHNELINAGKSIRVGDRVRSTAKAFADDSLVGTVVSFRDADAYAVVVWDGDDRELQHPMETLERVEPVPKFSSVEEADAWLERQAEPVGHPPKGWVGPADEAPYVETGRTGSLTGMGSTSFLPGHIVDMTMPGDSTPVKARIDTVHFSGDGTFEVHWTEIRGKAFEPAPLA